MKKVIKNIGKLLIGLMLLIISISLSILLFPWGLIETCIQLFWKKRFWKGLGMLGEMILLIATIVDVTGNVVMQVPLNRILIIDEAYKFGSRFDTISYVLGHALIHHNLTPMGKFICNILDKFEKNHCVRTYYLREVFNS